MNDISYSLRRVIPHVTDSPAKIRRTQQMSTLSWFTTSARFTSCYCTSFATCRPRFHNISCRSITQYSITPTAMTAARVPAMIKQTQSALWKEYRIRTAHNTYVNSIQLTFFLIKLWHTNDIAIFEMSASDYRRISVRTETAHSVCVLSI